MSAHYTERLNNLIYNIHEVSEEVKNLDGWRKCSYEGCKDHSKVALSMMRASVGVQLTQNIPNYSEGIATKIFEYLLLGIPTLMTETPFRKNFYGRLTNFVTNDDPKIIAGQLLWIRDHYADQLKQARKNQKRVKDNYVWATESKKLIDIYDKILGKC